LNRRQEILRALQLTRPRQWPILTAQFVVGLMIGLAPAPGAAIPWTDLAFGTVGAAWLCWVVLLNGGTLAFNSAFDRDTGPVAYLACPPEPPRWLAVASGAAMATGAALGWMLVGPGFGLVISGCVILSLLYSHPRVRLKSRPGLDLATNMIGYGAGTTAAGILAGRAAAGVVDGPVLGQGGSWLVLGFGLLFGSFYPPTQLYQADADRVRGDRTLVTALGTTRSLTLALILGCAATAAFTSGLAAADRSSGPIFLVTMGLWLLHLAVWLARGNRMTAAEEERGMYRGLVVWAAVDAALVFSWLDFSWFGR